MGRPGLSISFWQAVSGGRHLRYLFASHHKHRLGSASGFPTGPSKAFRLIRFRDWGLSRAVISRWTARILGRFSPLMIGTQETIP